MSRLRSQVFSTAQVRHAMLESRGSGTHTLAHVYEGILNLWGYVTREVTRESQPSTEIAFVQTVGQNMSLKHN